ncbi:1-deoxy-D-xylulose 5-phosphate reductoisomerase [Longimycelium tulufanense]|uniref:1-deoxy-D-xylulose 5-phosphate reductoisomerase n=1 Tax=Longimycelium tulufanense TaxID=907463 RepID=A0A8J3C6B5_9PSEU|nr:1-deoxy-D-xylulose-5-phosphate reductoisomerase [Longimycelium tulufanense]GGM39078.1 1-deoxy-D-xylulose 5-phosphate reductoisomerase [Longimycelium tulufanense]
MASASSPGTPLEPPQTSPSGRRDVLVLGSTGSIGTQALDVVRRSPDRFRVVGLAAGGADPATLAAQALEFGAAAVAVARASAVEDLQLAMYAEAQRRGYARGAFALPRILAGPESLTELVATTPADVVLNGVVGSRGLPITLAALRTGATLALANKESLVAGGPLVLERAKPGQIVPVDSEHSALAQCLRGGRAAEVDRLVLTASGGPFRGRRREELAEVTVEQALNHPTWAMGQVITISSATLVNKGLELIEAHLLFGVPYERIDVVVHPQSIVHSMVTFTDGSTIAQASPPDMRLPIALALGWPQRVPEAAPACSFAVPTAWTFEPVDDEAFPAITLARHAGTVGGCLPAIYNAANEEAVEAFVAGRIQFPDIVDTLARVLSAADGWHDDPAEVVDVLAAEDWARARARELVTAAGTAAGVGRNTQ